MTLRINRVLVERDRELDQELRQLLRERDPLRRIAGKGRAPDWQPATLQDVEDEAIERADEVRAWLKDHPQRRELLFYIGHE